MPKTPLYETTGRVFFDQFPSGLKVVLHPFQSPAVGLMFLIRCGAVFEKKSESGISHFLEHMLFRGIPEYPGSTQLAFALDRVGSEFNAATFSDMTMISIKVLPEALEKAMHITRSILCEPLLNDIETERRIILEECLEDLDEKGTLISPDQLSAKLLFPEHPYSNPIVGSPESIKSITSDKLRKFLHEHYRPDNCVIAISGGISQSEARKTARKIFGSWVNSDKDPNGKAVISIPELFNGPKFLHVPYSRSQVHCRVAFRSLPFSDPDYYVEKALIYHLDSYSGSPLREAMQDRSGYCYSLGVGNDSYDMAGSFCIDYTVHPDGLVHSLSECFGVLDKLLRNQISDDSLEHVIFQYYRDRRLSGRDLWDCSGEHAFYALYPGQSSPNREYSKFGKLSKQRFSKVIKRIFRRGNMGLVLVGPVSKKTEKDIQTMIKAFPD